MKIALCLSGGGFRASLYHLGVLKALRELDLLRDVVLVSAASGGAVTAAAFLQCARRTRPSSADGEAHRQTWFDFDAFEKKLLQATKAGALGGYTRSVALLLCLWIGLAGAILLTAAFMLPAPDWLLEILIDLVALATILGLVLFVGLVPEARRHAAARRELARSAQALGIPDPFSTRRRVCIQSLIYPWMPRIMRTATLDEMLFEHQMLGGLLPSPRLFLAAVELNRGCEMIFSQAVLSQLGAQGAVALWEQSARHGEANPFARDDYGYPFRFSYDASALPIAEAVAASSAYPPFFPPVRVRSNQGPAALVGDFIDGGVLDNAAVNAPLEMLLHLSAVRSRYRDEAQELASFDAVVTDLLVANAGAALVNRPRFWTLWRGLKRTVETMAGHQETLVDVTLALVRRIGRPRVRAITHRVGFPGGSGLESEAIARAVSRIRTHFDAFDTVETAVLVYLGYHWTRVAMEAPEAGAKSFAEICRAVTGSDAVARMTPLEIERHLAFSRLRMAFQRGLGRWRAGLAAPPPWS